MYKIVIIYFPTLIDSHVHIGLHATENSASTTAFKPSCTFLHYALYKLSTDTSRFCLSTGCKRLYKSRSFIGKTQNLGNRKDIAVAADVFLRLLLLALFFLAPLFCFLAYSCVSSYLPTLFDSASFSFHFLLFLLFYFFLHLRHSYFSSCGLVAFCSFCYHIR